MRRPRPLARRTSRRTALLCLALIAPCTPAAAQSLDEQYEFYLGSNCAEMNFARDGFFVLLPGQAGPNLKAFCDGPPPVGGSGGEAGASGGGAGVAGAVAAEDAALRRRARARTDSNDQDASSRAESPNDMSLVDMGKVGAFLSLDYLREKQDTTTYEGGRDSDLLAGTLGIDYRFGTKGLAGVALRFEGLSGEFDSGGDYETKGTGFTLYGSWFPTAASFIDVSTGMNFRSEEVNRIVFFTRGSFSFPPGPPTVISPPTPASSDKDSDDYGAQLSGGYDFYAGRFTVGPRAAVSALKTHIDAFSETGTTPMTLVVDEQEEESLRTAVGIQASLAFSPGGAVLVTQLNADWQHEFEDDQRAITARFAEDLRAMPTQFQFLNEAPDRDVFLTRLSVVTVFTEGLSAYFSANALLGHSYLTRYGATLGARFTF